MFLASIQNQPNYTEENEIDEPQHEESSLDFIPHEEYSSDDSYSEEMIGRSKRTSTGSMVSTTNRNITSTTSKCKLKTLEIVCKKQNFKFKVKC